MGEADHPGAGELCVAFSVFCEQRHVQDPVRVDQGKAA